MQKTKINAKVKSAIKPRAKSKKGVQGKVGFKSKAKLKKPLAIKKPKKDSGEIDKNNAVIVAQDITFEFPAEKESSNLDSIKKIKIRVIGVGGGGGSIVSEIAQKVKRASFVAVNTDNQALRMISRKVIRFNFGENLTQGFGAGMDNELASVAAENEKEKFKKLLLGQDLCIFVSCLGGGTGSGAMPILARIARNLGIITYGIFTIPFKFEGEKKIQIAIETLDKLKPNLNAMSIIPNDRIFQIINKNTPLKVALSNMNKILGESLEALLNTIYSPGLINVDFADLRTVFDGRGRLTYLNSLETLDIDKNDDFVNKVLNSPMYPYSIRGSRGIVINIVGSKDLGLKDVSRISKTISDNVNKDAKIILGISQKQTKDGKIRITLLATGCGQRVFADSKSKPKKTKPSLQEDKKPKLSKKAKAKKKKKQQAPKKRVKKIPVPIEQPLLESEDALNREQGLAAAEAYIRRNAMDIKKEIEETEKEIIEREKKWEIPAFLRRKN